MTAPRFTLADLERASESWGCNCGPTALAAIAGLTLDEVRPHLQGFDDKRYTNPTMMFGALQSIGRPWQRIRTSPLSGAAAHMPWWGLCRIQWHGPWTAEGANPRWAYRQTHWIGAAKRKTDGGLIGVGDIGVFDVNCVNETPDSGWVSLEDWQCSVVPFITADIPRASGGWHITHAIEVERR
jgi:hypothetical protein